MEHITNIDIYIRFFVAFGIIIALIGFAAWLARILGFNTSVGFRGKRQRRLTIVDAIALDTKRRIILVSRDDVEHLICIGGSTDFLIEANLKTPISSINKDIVEELSNPAHIKRVS